MALGPLEVLVVVSWVPLGRLLGAFWGLLGASEGLFQGKLSEA